MLGLTFLNPHVYLDTVLLLGTIGASFGDQRWWFALGAAAASVVWFTGLGFGARLLSPLMARPLTWRILDSAIGVVMLLIAVALVRSAVG
jgi:L-lysine exporter family protein LysE/ArgO